MSWELPSEIAERLTRLLKQPLVPEPEQGRGATLERAQLEALLPHRGEALLLDRALVLEDRGVVVARHRLERSATLLVGHFPGQPVWPGVQQIEAIGQAGLVLARRGGAERAAVRLVSVLAARFVGAVEPPVPVDVQAELIPDGLFCCVVGQCLQNGAIRSVAALRLMVEED